MCILHSPDCAPGCLVRAPQAFQINKGGTTSPQARLSLKGPGVALAEALAAAALGGQVVLSHSGWEGIKATVVEHPGAVQVGMWGSASARRAHIHCATRATSGVPHNTPAVFSQPAGARRHKNGSSQGFAAPPGLCGPRLPMPATVPGHACSSC
jgi:hypothetical protein